MISLAEVVSPIADREARDGSGTDEIVGASLALRRVLRYVDVVSPTDSTVLIQGETGQGRSWSRGRSTIEALAAPGRSSS